MNIAGIENFVVKALGTQLSLKLHYHNLSHTLDVVKNALRIAQQEGVHESYDLVLLKTAGYLHDIGFLNTFIDHEEEGCLIAQAILPDYNYDQEAIDIICSMIMKTKLPQKPVTLLEKILCDADLDHLGREDFKEVSHRLFEEWKALGRIDESMDWNLIQYTFVDAHHYWTNTNQKRRNNLKAQFLQELKGLVMSK
ncbi:MAG: HD domain-containing protein [Bacteroidetes bacterium]|nr:HD domain-containing protein [Bacteroidota bacterium]